MTLYMYVLCLQMHLFVENTYNIYAGNIGPMTISLNLAELPIS